MLEITFITTSQLKLAHARYLAEPTSIKVKNFKKTYHASYAEPRINDRDELLSKSYERALEQAKKASIDTSKNFFFIEDTSVVIDALSSSTKEVPGLDVKYWMRGLTFVELDNRLRKKGGSRTTYVRSDILLHLPETYKDQWGISENYIIFTGKQAGVVSDKEYKITTNPIYPWLDDITFNKWFIPYGESKPLSMLPIDKADKYDFRGKAFEKMHSFLKTKIDLKVIEHQASLSLNNAPTVLVSGYTCSGKTTISQWLVHKYGYIHIEASDFMYLNYYIRHGVQPSIDITDFAEKALNEKPHIVVEKVYAYMEKLTQFPKVISGFRSIEEISWLIDRYGSANDILAVFVNASESIRFKRHKERKRQGIELREREFKEVDNQQHRMGLEGIFKEPFVKKIDNEKSLQSYFTTFENSFLKNEAKLDKYQINLSKLKAFSNSIRIENAVLLALFSEWDDSESRSYFTTTEISKIISKIFPLIIPKHKDNISRYFNQDFYPYYEIDADVEENKRRYRLSNTGYGKAYRIFIEYV